MARLNLPMPDFRVDVTLEERDGVAGLAVRIVDVRNDEWAGFKPYEVGRVAFVRQNSENPEQEFAERLGAVMERADIAIEKLDEAVTELQRARELAEQEYQQREEEIVNDLRETLSKALGSRRTKKFS